MLIISFTMSGGPKVQYTKLLQMFIFWVISRKIIPNLKVVLKNGN